MHYNVAFDVTRDGIRDSGHTFSVGMALILGYIAITALKARGNRDELLSVLNISIVGVILFGTVAAQTILLAEHHTLASALTEGRCHTVEGTVTDFHPMPAAGHDAERFKVGSIAFEYSDFVTSPGFRNAASLGGPIREGMRVRIHHLNNDIARLEICVG